MYYIHFFLSIPPLVRILGEIYMEVNIIGDNLKPSLCMSKPEVKTYQEYDNSAWSQLMIIVSMKKACNKDYLLFK